MLNLPKKNLEILQESSLLNKNGEIDITENHNYQEFSYMISEKILFDEGIYYLINTFGIKYSDIGII